MGIVASNPPTGLDQADQAWFESDAPTNDEAIREIDAEAAKHGLARVKEYWLQTRRLPDGRVVRRGFCYRPAPTNLADSLAARRGMAVVGKPSSQLIREMRDAGE